MRKLRGFVLGWYYPPGNSSEGLVTYKLLKNSKIDYDVFTRKSFNATVWDRKTDESSLTAPNVTVIKSKFDYPAGWASEALSYFEKNADKYDFVMSRVMPEDSNIAAAHIKEKHPDIPWLASFGDPLVDSPYIKHILKNENPFLLKKYIERERPGILKALRIAISPLRQANKFIWEKEREQKMIWPLLCEKANDLAFKHADKLIFNNKYQFDLAFSKKHKQCEDKGVIVRHGFDLDLYRQPESENNVVMRFVYVGHLDEMRNAQSLLLAITHLKEKNKKLSKMVRFDFYGHMSDADKLLIIENDLSDVVKLHADINYLDSLKEMKKADWLILIDANLTGQLKEYIYFPAKLVDYFGAKKPVLAITHVNGTSADAIREVGAGQVVTHSADEIYMYLSKIIYKKYNPTKYNPKQLNLYNEKTIARDFDNMVSGVVAHE